MSKRLVLIGMLILIGGLLVSGNAFAFDFTPGDFYTTSPETRTIKQFGPTGESKDSITVALDWYETLRGVAFGPDNLLYVSVATSNAATFRVIALDASGTIHRSYSGTGYMGGNLGYGNIVFDHSGNWWSAAVRRSRGYSRPTCSSWEPSIPRSRGSSRSSTPSRSLLHFWRSARALSQ